MKIDCKVCGSEKFKIVEKPNLSKFPYPDKDYKIVQCQNCLYYFVSPEIDLSQEQWSSLYSDNYFENANKTSWQIKVHKKERKKRLLAIQSKLEIGKGNFLEFGCGEGYVLSEAHNVGFKPFGVDIADNLNLTNKSFNFFKGSIFEANIPDDYFSAIYLDQVLEHVLNPFEIIVELRRILAPGGVLMILVPNEDSTISKFSNICYKIMLSKKRRPKIKPFEPPYHVGGFNPHSLETILMKSGFSKIEIETFGGNYKFWNAYKPLSTRYMLQLFLYPLGLLSILFKNQIEISSISVK
jgi:SAM-dependent methyltransferase